MTAVAFTKAASAGSTRLLVHVQAFDERDPGVRAPALIRLEAALGRDFADRLVSALTDEHDERQS